LIDDLLTKRNRRLLAEIDARLPQSERIIVPWGVAHMPGIAKQIRQSGFRVVDTRDYLTIRFPSLGGKSRTASGQQSDN
jgi:hypothetical protein